jgi:protease I
MTKLLEGKTVAILLTDGFEQVEMTAPRKALQDAGARTVLVSPKPDEVQGMNHHDVASRFKVDVALSDASAERYDALLLPGGVANPDALRVLPAARALVSEMFASGKPIAAICHGPWTLIDAGVVEGIRMTSWPSLRADLTNAGARWVDEEVVVDDGIVTSRKPDDIPAFNAKMIEAFAQGVRARDTQPSNGRAAHAEP